MTSQKEYFYIQRIAELEEQVAKLIKVNGKDVKLIATTTKKIHHKNILKELALIPWSMYKINCQKGKNDISVTIQGDIDPEIRNQRMALVGIQPRKSGP